MVLSLALLFGIIIVEDITLSDIKGDIRWVITCSILNYIAIVLFFQSVTKIIAPKDILKLFKNNLFKGCKKYIITFIIAFLLMILGVSFNVGVRITFNIVIFLNPVYETYSVQGVYFLFGNIHIFGTIMVFSIFLSKHQSQLLIEQL